MRPEARRRATDQPPLKLRRSAEPFGEGGSRYCSVYCSFKDCPISTTASHNTRKSSEVVRKFDDAGAQQVAAVDDRVRDVRAATLLQRGEDALVQGIQRLLIRGVAIGARRNVTERGDAQALRDGLELGMCGGALEELAGQAHVLAD